MATSGLFNNTTVTTPGDDTQHVVEVDKVQVNVFFDGTLNNVFNIKAPEEVKKTMGGDGTSYANGLSNVGRMWEGLNLEFDSPDFSIYVEGIGTAKYQQDSFDGYVAGEGDTGIVNRVESVFGPIKDRMQGKVLQDSLPGLLEINAFGFSRGAAAARYFVYLVQQEASKRKYFDKDWSSVILRVNFVGLFDTVSSHGYWSYRDDVDALHLKIEASKVHRVFHVVALDEYRSNFSCTNIQSTVKAGKGYEICIPGAHSDVGGGYTSDQAPETELRDIMETRLEQRRGGAEVVPGTREFAYRKGWYSKGNATPTLWHSSRHSRLVIGDYYKVALSLMVDAAEKYTTVRFPSALTEPCDEPEIEAVRTQILAQGRAEQSSQWVLEEHLGEEAARNFRNRFLHMSFQEGGLAHAPRFKNDTDLERRIVST